ncbi:hypothetical protein DL96DRAFT_1722066 [Flagelloscypha sp. PMI_526]|nr:hypothetical protein DL96DRAFT_1722066 [Flagelloscypha sp. PMI_526]
MLAAAALLLLFSVVRSETEYIEDDNSAWTWNDGWGVASEGNPHGGSSVKIYGPEGSEGRNHVTFTYQSQAFVYDNPQHSDTNKDTLYFQAGGFDTTQNNLVTFNSSGGLWFRIDYAIVDSSSTTTSAEPTTTSSSSSQFTTVIDSNSTTASISPSTSFTRSPSKISDQRRGAIIGGSIAAGFVVCALVVTFFLCRKRQRRKENEANHEGTPQMTFNGNDRSGPSSPHHPVPLTGAPHQLLSTTASQPSHPLPAKDKESFMFSQSPGPTTTTQAPTNAELQNRVSQLEEEIKQLHQRIPLHY